MDSHGVDRPLVVVVVLNWNGWSDTVSCLARLDRLTYPRREVVVVDNGSTDGSEDRIRSAVPEVRLIQTGANLGFAGGNNAGIRYALAQGAEFVWLLNNDTEVPENCLTALVDAMQREPRMGILSPTVFHMETGRPEPLNVFPPGVRRPTVRGADAGADVVTAGIELLDTAPGAAMLVRRAVLEELVGLDESYFHFFEDTDFCWRAWRAGWLVGRASSATLLHRYGTSTNAARPLVLYYMLRNILLFSARAAGIPARTLLWRRPRLWLWALGPLLGVRSFRRPATKIAVIRALFDATRGRSGRCRAYSPL
ncbi:MAG: glycosyltransferase family 2 protein [Chloroflexota bacterium]